MSDSDEVKSPGWLRVALEARAPFEFAASVFAAPILATATRGDGHPVIVYPGFMGTDASTKPLRRLLRWLGYAEQGWRQGRNMHPTHEVFEKARAHIRQVHQQHGRKVSLVGWSLGGIYARELAKLEPDCVRCVVTLGSPFNGARESTNAAGLFQWVNRGRRHLEIPADALRQAPPVPCSSIYSRTDGVVSWRASLDALGPMTENIEVHASHIGMGVNPLVLLALADRLAQSETDWEPFRRTGWRRFTYRDPQRPPTT